MVELPVHLGFITRKNNILQKLTLPDSEYTDLSPKGSIDNGIRDLINDINKLHGLVTTSSCAGRVSVFVEGSKRTYTTRGPTGENEENFRGDSGFEEKGGNTGKKNTSDHPSIKESLGRIYTDPGHRQEPTRQFVAAGGKGAGYWLYVSHDPVSIEEGKISFHKQFGLTPGNGVPNIKESKRSTRTTRLVRFSFEPMILHIMTASLKHAQPVLLAASSAGFRESGLQSLRCLDYEGDNTKVPSRTDGGFPIVAVRSAGLALESVIGYCETAEEISYLDSGRKNNDLSSDEPDSFIIRSLVTEEYLGLLVSIANERFEENKRRIARFRANLIQHFASLTLQQSALKPSEGKKSRRYGGREDPIARWERKRAEGLQRQSEIAQKRDISEPMGLDGEESPLSIISGSEDSMPIP